MSEKNFWSLFHSHQPSEVDHQRIETGSTGRGIPDVNFCHQGGEFWVELKLVKGRSIDLSPEQVAWHFRRTRAGGKTFIIARDKFDGPRKGKGDIIYLWHGCDVVQLKKMGLDCPGLVFKAPFDWDLLWMTLMQKT